MASDSPAPVKGRRKSKTSMTEMEALRSLLHLYQSDAEMPLPPIEPLAPAADLALEKFEPSQQAMVEVEPTPAPVSGDWPGALRLVEQAASVIDDYERRFRDIEVDARAFLEHVDEERQRLLSYVATLEMEVVAAEDRGRRAEAALDEMRLQAWEERVLRRHAETRAADAEAEVEKNASYRLRIYEILERLGHLDGHRPAGG